MEVKPRRATLRYRRPLAAAAMTIGVCGRLPCLSQFDGGQGKHALAGSHLAQGAHEASASSEDDFDKAADYFMIDESDMYAYQQVKNNRGEGSMNTKDNLVALYLLQCVFAACTGEV